MTVKQKQYLLGYMGLLQPEDVDGIWGPQSAEATAKAQRMLGIPDDGVWGDQTDAAIREYIYSGEELEVSETTDAFWNEIEFFDREEFRCQCGGKYCDGFPVEPQEKMVRTVNEIRRRLGVPVSIVTAGGSGVRCSIHNANVGGVGNSNHLYGRAADLHSEKSPTEMYQVAESVLGNTGELGLYNWGIHVGVNCAYSRYVG
jgi:hypothetical protein